MLLEIQIGNKRMRIVVGGQQPRGDGNGGDGPGDPPSDTGTGGPQGHCCTPVVVGPIVVSGSSMASDNGGDGPGDPPTDTGTGKPVGGDGPGDPPTDTGTGGPPDANGCCCQPIIIGPIVFTDCSSGDGSTTTSKTSSQPVTILPPPQLTAQIKTNQTLPFTMQEQEEHNWCWAAVAVSVNDFLDSSPETGSLFDQGALATQLLRDEFPAALMDCTQDPDASNPQRCNRPERLDMALNKTNNLRPGGALTKKYLTFIAIQAWIDAGLPVCARIAWSPTTGHFVALDGTAITAAGQQLVHVQDPLQGVAPSFWDYSAFCDSYDGIGTWSDTYLVQR